MKKALSIAFPAIIIAGIALVVLSLSKWASAPVMYQSNSTGECSYFKEYTDVGPIIHPCEWKDEWEDKERYYSRIWVQ